MKKIFCIGFNKTGTTSLHFFFKSLGFSSDHSSIWPYLTHSNHNIDYFLEFDCFTDGEMSNVHFLNSKFPESLFILNSRNIRDWLRSRVKHVLRDGVPSKEKLFSNSYGKMARDFFTNPKATIEKWIMDRIIYHAQVRDYFSNKHNFFEIDITIQDNWQDFLYVKICDMKFSPVKLASGISFHENARVHNYIKDQNELLYYYDLIDACVFKILNDYKLNLNSV